MSRARMWRSNVAGRMIITIDCLLWRPNWFTVMWTDCGRRRNSFGSGG